MLPEVVPEALAVHTGCARQRPHRTPGSPASGTYPPHHRGRPRSETLSAGLAAASGFGAPTVHSGALALAAGRVLSDAASAHAQEARQATVSIITFCEDFSHLPDFLPLLYCCDLTLSS